MQTQVQNYRVHMYTIRSTVFEDGSVDALRLCSGDGRGKFVRRVFSARPGSHFSCQLHQMSQQQPCHLESYKILWPVVIP